jgi:hypothetical protein
MFLFYKAVGLIEYKELWLTYSQGSGQTAQLPDLKKFLNSDNSDKEHYDSLVQKIQKAKLLNKVIKSKGKTTLYEVPVYPMTNMGQKYDIWDGEVKPTKTIFMMVTEEKSTIINMFEKKGEALAWLKSTV